MTYAKQLLSRDRKRPKPLSVTSAQVVITVLSAVDNEMNMETQLVKPKRKLGFMQGEMIVPEDIHWGDKQVQDMFNLDVF